MKPVRRTAPSSKKHPPSSFVGKIKKRRMIETASIFIGGGWFVYEIVHFILVEHYHLPEGLKDIVVVSVLGTMFSALTWRWFRADRARARKVKVEFLLVPLFLLVTAALDTKFALSLRGPGVMAGEGRWTHSLAVLPFVNISGDESQEYFCDGLTEELINRLSQVRQLKVAARTSAFAFKGAKVDVAEVARQLKVERILEGSVRREGDRLRVTAQLIQGSDGYHVWSEKFERRFEDAFAIQDEIALAIADRMELDLARKDRAALTRRPTESLEANSLYMRGRHFWNKRTEGDIRRAIAYFEQARDKDPNYAPAYVGLADCYILLPEYARSDTREVLSKARAAVSMALTIDRRLAEAYASLGLIEDIDWNSKAAETAYRRAIELNPNYAPAHLWYFMFLAIRGRFDEAQAEIEETLKLDPLSLIASTGQGQVWYFQGAYDRAIAQHMKTLELDANFLEARLQLGRCYRQKGLLEEAVAELMEVRRHSEQSPYGLGVLGNAYAVLGRVDEARKVIADLESLSQKGASVEMDTAFVFLGLDDMDRAFEWLDKAYAKKQDALAYLNVDPEWEKLRADPRYKALKDRIGIF